MVSLLACLAAAAASAAAAAAATAGPGAAAAAAVPVPHLDGRERVRYTSESVIHAFALISSLAEGEVIPGEQDTVEAMCNTGDVHAAAPLRLS